MINRAEAEQKLADDLYNAGIIGTDSDMSVRRLDFRSPFFVFCNKEIIGKVNYNHDQNKFYGFKSTIRNPKKDYRNEQYQPRKFERMAGKVFSIADFLKSGNKIKI